MATSKAKQKLRDRRREEGKCLDCEELATRAGRCNKHWEAGRIQRKEYYTRKMDRAECITPGCTNEIYKDTVRCYDCGEKQREDYSKKVEIGICTHCTALATNGTSCDNHAKQKFKGNLNRKIKIMSHYGGPICVGCNETEIGLLQLDHKNGGGNKHRREIGGGDLTKGSGMMYQWVIDNGYPPLFRVLCANCNVRAKLGLAFPNDK